MRSPGSEVSRVLSKQVIQQCIEADYAFSSYLILMVLALVLL